MKQQAFNPFLPLDTYIPDGEPHVFGDRVYLYGSHDKEGGNTFCMLGYEVWSAPVDDLGNWTSSGIVFSPKDTPYYCEERPYLYAPDCVRGNDGRYYLYCCPAGDKGKGGYDGPILVAVSDAPDGKFAYLGEVKHPDGTPFQDCVLFDPAVINDGGVIRLYGGTGLWGGMQITRRNRFVMAKIASAVYHRPPEVFGGENDPLGPFMLVLDDDMMTVRSCTPHILPVPSKANGFLGHAFFEGASIRKIGDTYYFLYSSERNHELCYATSKYPDRGFVFGGTVVSNGDVGFLGRKQKDRLNHTGTTHGGIEKIGGKWYVFYHRQSHGSDYSRQACAEVARERLFPSGVRRAHRDPGGREYPASCDLELRAQRRAAQRGRGVSCRHLLPSDQRKDAARRKPHVQRAPHGDGRRQRTLFNEPYPRRSGALSFLRPFGDALHCAESARKGAHPRFGRKEDLLYARMFKQVLGKRARPDRGRERKLSARISYRARLFGTFELYAGINAFTARLPA